MQSILKAENCLEALKLHYVRSSPKNTYRKIYTINNRIKQLFNQCKGVKLVPESYGGFVKGSTNLSKKFR